MAGNSRQQWYDRIRASSKDEVILEEMKRLGFWPDDQEKPGPGEELIKRKGELQRELNELMRKQHLYQDPEQALKLMRKQRMEDSKERRKQTKQRRLQQKYDKAMHWHQRRQKEILYLGDGVSTGLNQVDSDTDKLDNHELPLLHNATDIAQAMGVSLAELRFLSFSRDISRINHYQRFAIPKKTGGTRAISAPMPRLKRAQYWLLDNILENVPLHDAAHGFRRQRSIVSNAKQHTGSYVVVNFDIKDFFPTIHYARVKGLFRQLGYSNQASTIFALLCTEPDVQQLSLDGDNYYVKNGERHLPQGAPCSPAISNIICRRLDRRLHGAAKSLGFRYTRYADDMSFSSDRSHAKNLAKLQWRVQQIVSEEGFALHPDKTRVMRSNSRQDVTGIVVNEKPSLERKTLKRFRALLYQLEKDGPEGKFWQRDDLGSAHVLHTIEGFANYINMVDPAKGQRYKEQVKRIVQKQGYRYTSNEILPLSPALMRSAAAQGKAPRDSWWQPVELPPPEPPKPEEEKKPQHATQRTSTNELIDSAVRQRHQGVRMPRHGSWRRLFVKLKSLFWWAVFIYIAFLLSKSSPVLAVIFVAAGLYFRRALSR